MKMEFEITQRYADPKSKIHGSTTVTGDDVSAPYDVARHVQALLHSLDSSLQARGYGNTGGGAQDNDAAIHAFAEELRAMEAGNGIGLGDVTVDCVAVWEHDGR